MHRGLKILLILTLVMGISLVGLSFFSATQRLKPLVKSEPAVIRGEIASFNQDTLSIKTAQNTIVSIKYTSQTPVFLKTYQSDNLAEPSDSIKISWPEARELLESIKQIEIKTTHNPRPIKSYVASEVNIMNILPPLTPEELKAMQTPPKNIPVIPNPGY